MYVLKLITCWMQTNGGTTDVWGSWICRYNVSCSQHYKTSRGRTGVGLTSLPAPNDSAARRRGPSRRSSSNMNNLSSRHLPVKVRSVVQPGRCKNLFFFVARYFSQVIIPLLFFLKDMPLHTILTLL